jgi:carbon monoxide dehydrogenase subunit G
MIVVKRDIAINAPLERVFAYVSAPVRMAEWIPGLVEVRELIGTVAGQQFEWTCKMAGILLRGQSTVVEFVENERSVHQSIGTINGVWTYTIEAQGEGTLFSIEAEYTLPIPVLGKMLIVTINALSGSDPTRHNKLVPRNWAFTVSPMGQERRSAGLSPSATSARLRCSRRARAPGARDVEYS